MSQAANDVNSNDDALVDLLDYIEYSLKRVDIYSRIPPTHEMHETVFNIIVELLSTLALATKELRQGRASESLLLRFLTDGLPLLNTSQSHS